MSMLFNKCQPFVLRLVIPYTLSVLFIFLTEYLISFSKVSVKQEKRNLNVGVKQSFVLLLIRKSLYSLRIIFQTFCLECVPHTLPGVCSVV